MTEKYSIYMMTEFESAKQAQNRYHNVGAPDKEKFKAIISSNLSNDCPVSEHKKQEDKEQMHLLINLLKFQVCYKRESKKYYYT